MEEGVFFITTLLSGFYAGIGFFTAIGANPAAEKMTDRTFAEYWQQLDHYMGSRMPVFGIVLLVSLIASIVLLGTKSISPSFWLMLAGFVIIVADIIFTVRVNHPLSHLIQSWNINELPGDVQVVKQKVVHAFNWRIICMISSFIMVLLSVWARGLSR